MLRFQINYWWLIRVALEVAFGGVQLLSTHTYTHTQVHAGIHTLLCPSACWGTHPLLKCMMEYTHPPVDRQTPVKTLSSHNFVCGR